MAGGMGDMGCVCVERHVWQEGLHGRGHAWQGGCVAGGGNAWRGGAYVAREMATKVGITHPAGMHSCLFNKNYENWIHYIRNVILN